VDTPALLPDRSVSELSVSATLKARGTVLDSRDLVKPVDETVDAITDEEAPSTTEEEQL
jgi:NADH-quinone oxidoreductase subunit J